MKKPSLQILQDFEIKKKNWEEKANKAKREHPLKILKTLPKMVFITKSTHRFLRLKALIYLLKYDSMNLVKKYVLKNPLKYGFRLLKSYISIFSYTQKDDFFFYNLKTKKELVQKIKDPHSHFILGFSYCHKPFECPSGRFTDQCVNDPQNPVCKQCFIGKCVYLSENIAHQPLFIKTVHHIGEKMFEACKQYPKKKIVFLITACELTLKMFADWGNMLGIQGIGVRLQGRVCNTMKAFELSENGIKPGLTVVTKSTQEEILTILRDCQFPLDFKKTSPKFRFKKLISKLR